MLEVFLTIDVEIWCDGWTDIDARFPDAFRKYIYGPTRKGDFGLPYQLNLLNEFGLSGTCFVEPLFSTRFGEQPLQEIIGLIAESGHEIQAHLHTEWADEARIPLFPTVNRKRQYLFHFDRDEQTQLVAEGLKLLQSAGADGINAFRAGSFGFNLDTLHALANNGIRFDSSYNANMFGPQSGLRPGTILTDAVEYQSVVEIPMTVFRDGLGSLRQAQLTSCSWREMEQLLWRAVENEQRTFTILSHNFELLNPSKTRPDDIVVGRLKKLCRFLDRHRDVFKVSGFNNLEPELDDHQPPLLKTGLVDTGARILAQAYRRRYQ